MVPVKSSKTWSRRCVFIPKFSRDLFKKIAALSLRWNMKKITSESRREISKNTSKNGTVIQNFLVELQKFLDNICFLERLFHRKKRPLGSPNNGYYKLMEIVGFGTQIESCIPTCIYVYFVAPNAMETIERHLKNVSYLTVRRLLPKRFGRKI